MRIKEPVPVYGELPPVAETITVELPPKHEIGVEVSEATNCVGAVITIPLMDVIHPLASVIVTVYVPAPTFERFCVVALLLHK